MSRPVDDPGGNGKNGECPKQRSQRADGRHGRFEQGGPERTDQRAEHDQQRNAVKVVERLRRSIESPYREGAAERGNGVRPESHEHFALGAGPTLGCEVRGQSEEQIEPPTLRRGEEESDEQQSTFRRRRELAGQRMNGPLQRDG